MRNNIQVIEFIVGKKNLQECYKSNPDNITEYVEEKLEKYINNEKIKELRSAIRKEASIVYYGEEVEEKTSKIVLEELCDVFRKENENNKFDLAEMLSNYIEIKSGLYCYYALRNE